MALVPQSPFLSSLKPINTSLPTTKSSLFTFKNFKLSSSLGPSNAQSSPQEEEPQGAQNDAIKLALAKATAYKKAVKSNPTPQIVENLVQESDEVDKNNNGLVSENEDKLAFQKVEDSKKNNEVVGVSNNIVEGSERTSGVERGDSGNPLSTLLKKSVDAKDDLRSNGLKSDDKDNGDQDVPLAVKLALEKAKKYKENKGVLDSDKLVEGSEETSGVERGNSGDSLSALLQKSADTKEESRSNGLKSDEKDNGDQEVPLAVKLALEKAKKYKEDKEVLDSNKPLEGSQEISELKRRFGVDPASTLSKNKANKKEELKVSGIDFLGLGFADKKSRGLPAGLVPVADLFPEGDLPEVEIVVGDTSKFGDGGATKVQPSQEDNVDIYKPKVSTWGVFPRPSDISKTYGGGRTIRPGEVLETAEDKAAKQARTRQLVAAYNKKIGLNIDPKLKSECEKALKDGDALMDLGKLEEALPFYGKIMDNLAFQSELYGLAALQWSICQDSLSRRNEARVMYEKLQSHPNAQVRKKASQFMFGFQAMEMMKVTSSTPSMNIGYQSYFEAFVRDKENYSPKESEVDEGTLTQAFPYILFLVSPILIVLFIAVQKGGIN